jgi:FlaA1/EpsC-like NDP-sugar epimerase
MKILEAVKLVLCVETLDERGDVFVLDAGDPDKTLEVARGIALHVDRMPVKNVEIAFSGLRHGEKSSEGLTGPDELPGPAGFHKPSKFVLQSQNGYAADQKLDALLAVGRRNDRDGVYRILSVMGLGYKSRPSLIEDPANVD